MFDEIPIIKSLKPDQAIAMVTKSAGDVTLGRTIFENAKCANCHTLSQAKAKRVLPG